MTRRHKQQSAARRLRSLYLWHRWIGLLAATFVIVLSITGLALNHTESLSLDDTHVQSPALLDWYGIQAPDDVITFTAGPLTASALGKQIFIDTNPVANIEPPLVGAVGFGDLVVIAVSDRLLLFTHAGELVELLGSAAGIPQGIRSLGTVAGRQLVLRTDEGDYSTDSELLAWRRTDRVEADWSTPVTPPPGLIASLQAIYRGSGLPLERVILDLHSGRILGEWGVYLMDGAAIVFVLLAASGIWLWGRRRASARAHRRRISKEDRLTTGKD